MDLWRISRFQDLDGEGGLKASGRWHTKGSRIVYLSESPACALLEHLAHVDFDLDELPVSLTLLRIEAPNSLSRLNIQEDDLPEAWREDYHTTRSAGDHWLERQQEVFMVCPSVLVPRTFNWSLNPDHPQANRVRVAEVIEPALDPRLLRRRISLAPWV